MYSPSHYKVEDANLAREMIEKNAFATVITTNGEGVMISHLPLLIEMDGEQMNLIGHCARANPHWKEFAASQVKAIFHGPHAYISPAWYAPKPGNVPTWNYAAVHCDGLAELIVDETESYRILHQTVQYFESSYGTNWTMDAEPNPEVARLLKAIVAFRIRVDRIESKFKMSQKIDADDHARVVSALPSHGEMAGEVAELMARTRRG